MKPTQSRAVLISVAIATSFVALCSGLKANVAFAQSPPYPVPTDVATASDTGSPATVPSVPVSPPLADGSVSTGSARLGFAAAALSSLPTAAGRTTTRFSVSNDGAAQYEIPIHLPPALAALKLELSLSYNSRGPNGIMGVGWTIGGLSAISRCPKTWAQDGAVSGVSLTVTDRLCMSGGQLKLVSGQSPPNYVYAGNTFATEVESFASIVAQGSGSSVTGFKVISKNGLIYYYGLTADSQVYAGNSGIVRLWALSKIADRDGNAIALTYQNDTTGGDPTSGSFRILTITYPTTTTGLGPYYTVNFSYGLRPATDIPASYVDGYLVKEVNQLNSVSVNQYSSGSVIRQYNLQYTSGTATGRNTLTAVQECSASTCLPATTIGYQAGAPGWSGTRINTGIAESWGTQRQQPIPVDLNGDGKTDILIGEADGAGNWHWYVYWSLGSNTLSARFDTGIVTPIGGTNSYYPTIIPAHFNRGGVTGLLAPVGGTWKYYEYNGSAFVQLSDTGIAVNGEVQAADLDGDGLADLVSVTSFSTPGASVRVRKNVTATSGTVAFSSTQTTLWTAPSTSYIRQDIIISNSALSVVDFNGDGRADLLINYGLSTAAPSPNGIDHSVALISNGVASPMTATTFSGTYYGAVPGDVNGDGCTDLLINLPYGGTSNRTGYLSKCGNGFVAFSSPAWAIAIVDCDGDGNGDLLSTDTASFYTVACYRWNGQSFSSTPTDYFNGMSLATGYFLADLNGDGAPSILFTYYGYLNILPRVAISTLPDLATSFVDGFGMSQAPTYVPITNSTYYSKNTNATFPEVDFQGPLYVVSNVTASDGTASTYQNQFNYYGAKMHVQGRGFEGFYAQRVYDSRYGRYSYGYLGQSFPYTGMPLQKVVYADATHYDSYSSVQPQTTTLAGAGSAETRYLPTIASTTTNSYEVGGPKSGSLIAQVQTSYLYDGYANPTTTTTTTTDLDAAAPASPFNGLSWTSTVTNTYNNDTANWCLGLPATSSVTNSVPGQTSQSRTYSYTVDPPHCRTTQKVDQPGSATLAVTTTYTFDTSTCPGTLASVSVVGKNPDGSNMATRSTSYNYASTTTRCQLPEKITDALGNATNITYNYDFGVPLTSQDPNLLVTSWTLDDYGRTTKLLRPDGTYSTTSFSYCVSAPCWGLSDLRFLETETDYGSNGSSIASNQRFYDGFNRLRYNERNRVLGTWTTDVTIYDSLGRVYAQYQPQSSGSNGYTRLGYDERNRPTAKQLYDGSGTLNRTTGYSYQGQTTVVTDPLGNATSYVNDVAGRLRRIVDPVPGGTTNYAYDVFGNLNQTVDAIGATSSATYNLRGCRTQMVDADAGTWNFGCDSLNEVVSWTDAKAQSFSQVFDAMGRRTSRTEPEGTSNWVWGSSAAAHNIGALATVSGPGYSEALSYDSLGRLAQRTINTAYSFTFNYTYNTIGELDTEQFPVSPVPSGTAGSRFSVQHCYSYGFEYQLRDVTSTSAACGTAGPPVLYGLGAANDYSSPTSESFGSGAGLVALSAGYEAFTNHLASVQAGTGASTTNIQNLQYTWDVADNLRQRKDVNQSLTEVFTPDALNRLSSSTLNGNQNLALTYYASGDIHTRSDVGTYTYGASAHPHAVTVAGPNSYGYDANGNLTTHNTFTGSSGNQWASFNLPTLIKELIGTYTASSTFQYGPDHQRIKQIAVYPNGTETTYYAGSDLELMLATTTSVAYWRHYVTTPTGRTLVVSRNSDGTTSTNVMLTDHLGSADAIVNGVTGALNVQESFNPFGLRRQSNWQAGLPSYWQQSAISQATRHGFTGHEMLDSVGLIHMNGRVFDPRIGRFMSPDPLLGDLSDSQRLNPYSYVSNRPLIATDPTGYGGEEITRQEAEDLGTLDNIKSTPSELASAEARLALSSGGIHVDTGKNAASAQQGQAPVAATVATGVAITSTTELPALEEITIVAKRLAVRAGQVVSVEIAAAASTVAVAISPSNGWTRNETVAALDESANPHHLEAMAAMGVGGAATPGSAQETSTPADPGQDPEDKGGGDKKSDKATAKKKDLPTLDRTGKVHGDLPRAEDLSKYSRDELKRLRQELRESVQERIRKTSELGRDRAHGQRQAAEQQLINQIDKFLSGS